MSAAISSLVRNLTLVRRGSLAMSFWRMYIRARSGRPMHAHNGCRTSKASVTQMWP